jgi:16S rRNA (uracil1498-N3)-methyltransferase
MAGWSDLRKIARSDQSSEPKVRIVSYDFNAPRLYVDADLNAQAIIPLSREQSNYLSNVLRLTEGDDVLIFNGRDGEWQAHLAGSRKHLELIALQCVRAQTSLPHIHYVFAPLKHARLDYMIQKAVEMGASVLQPVMTRRTQVTRVNLERMHANAIEAAEQCGLLSLPEIRSVCTLDHFIGAWNEDDVLIFCDEDVEASNPITALTHHSILPLQPHRSIAVIIGPEGGFDPHERAALAARKNCIRLSLGPRILRADTAAVAALTLVQACLGDWSI